MSVRMIVTSKRITRREKARRRFRYWYKNASPHSRMLHFMHCSGCVGCTSVLAEISAYVEERGDVVR